jgi:hypothetical protein
MRALSFGRVASVAPGVPIVQFKSRCRADKAVARNQMNGLAVD